MIWLNLLRELAIATPSKIVLLVVDGIGGLPNPDTGRTELETASTPQLDRLAAESICGISEPVAPGITPGSGPAHLALFGYDPLVCNVGRGVLSALGVNFPLERTDVAARVNFASVGEDGNVVDRRAGRISTEENRGLVDKLRAIRLSEAEVFVEPEAGHRAVAIFRGENLSDQISDSDPYGNGLRPRLVRALIPEAERAAMIVRQFISEAERILQDEQPANAVLLRGFAKCPEIPNLKELYKIKPAAIAGYPMYRGLGQLIGMDVLDTGSTLAEEIKALQTSFGDYDYFFVHFKPTDSAGEDGDFDRKVAAIQEVDRLLPEIRALSPDVLVVTGDHSTPAVLASHSWHPVPFMLHSRYCLPDTVDRFSERACATGALGRFRAREAMALMLANALKLEKYGA